LREGSNSGAGWRARVALLGVAVVAFAMPAAASADQTITSAGPLSAVGITSDLNCAVNHVGDDSGEFYSDTACATIVALSDAVFGPSEVPAGDESGRQAWNEISQSGVTGSGTGADPYTIVTVVDNTVPDAGSTAGPAVAATLRATETDTYIVGEEQYRTDVTLTNLSGTTQEGMLYRAGDCYLQDSDSGIGLERPDIGAVACKALPESADPNRIEEWVPLTAGSHYYESGYRSVWNWTQTGQPFPDTCACTDSIDNGAGLSWSFSLAPGASATYSHLTVFSPTGNQLTVTKTADFPLTTPGGDDGYTITVTNPNLGPATLTSLVDHLPAGFSYAGGTTTGLSTSDPAVSGQDATWTTSTVIPSGGNVTLHFKVHASTTVGMYTDNAEGTASGGTSVPATGQTAPVIVATPPTITGGPYATQTLTCNPGGWPAPDNGRAYAWLRGGTAIAGANATTYVATTTDVGQAISCVEYVTYGTTSYLQTSAPLTIVGPPANTAPPTIGPLPPRVGGQLTCTQGTWTNNPASYAYQWTRNGQPIANAGGATYTPTASDAGATVTCVVTATNPAGSATATSAGALVPNAVLSPGPRDTTLQPGPGGTFRIQVLYQVRNTCSKPCKAHADIRTRKGPRVYSRDLAGDGPLLGTRTGLVLPTTKKIRFWLTIKKAALLKAPFKTVGGFRVAETRLRVYLKTPTGTLVTVRDGRIMVSIARIKSGKLPGLKGIL
jgi:uncharacterized repeat protein (TIGR01451 family)